MRIMQRTCAPMQYRAACLRGQTALRAPAGACAARCGRSVPNFLRGICKTSRQRRSVALVKTLA